MPSSPAWYDDADAPLAAAPQLQGDPGTPTAVVTVRLYNDKDGTASADPMQEVRLYGFARLAGQTTLLAEGHELVDRRYVEARITQGLGGLTAAATDWYELDGGSAYLTLPDLASTEGVEIEFRGDFPADAQGLAATLVLALVRGGYGLGRGHSESSGDGILLPVGDPLSSLIVSGGTIVENPAGADNQVQIPAFVYIASGIPYSRPAGLSGVIAASSAGFSRYVLVSLASDGSLTLTDGVESNTTLTDDDKPAIPSGDQAIAWIQVDTGIISDGDIEQAWSLSLYAASGAGTTVTVSRGPEALVDNAIPYTTMSQSAGVNLSTTSYIWLLRTGLLGVTETGLPPINVRGLLLAEVDTDGVGITEIRDRRTWAGIRMSVVHFRWVGTLAVASSFRYAVNPFDRTAYILPIRGLRASVGGTGDTSGSTDFGLSTDPAYDDVWTDLIGTGVAPSIAHDATDPRDLDAVPASLQVAAGARLRAEITAIPGGVASEDGSLEVVLCRS